MIISSGVPSLRIRLDSSGTKGCSCCDTAPLHILVNVTVPAGGLVHLPPDDWHPYQPVTYQNVNVWVPSVQRTVRV